MHHNGNMKSLYFVLRNVHILNPSLQYTTQEIKLIYSHYYLNLCVDKSQPPAMFTYTKLAVQQPGL